MQYLKVKYSSYARKFQVSKLTVDLIQSRLIEADEMKKVTAQKLKVEKARKPREVGSIKDFSTNLTKIKQVEVPKSEGKTSDKDSNSIIPQADFASTYTDKMPHGQGPGGGKGTNQKSGKAPSATSMKPNQQSKMKEIKGSIKRTDADGSQSAMALPQAEFAHTYVDKMAHGNKTLGGGNEAGGDGVSKPPVAKVKGGATRAGGSRSATRLGELPGGDKANPANVGEPSKTDTRKTKDSIKKVSWKKETGGSHNVIESGVVVKLRGKTKAVFDVVSTDVLHRMVENYQRFGYEVSLGRTSDVSWKKDSKFLGLLREAVNAKYNFAPQTQAKLRKQALNRFASLTRGSYNSMYESRQDYVHTIREAFLKIEGMAEGKYLDGLEIFECIARVKIEEDTIADLEIITEATDHHMALRQVRNQVAEEYGLDVKIGHIFVDGKKYSPRQIRHYSVKKISEKWDTDYETPKSKKGMFKGKNKADLEKQLSTLKKSGPHKKGSPEYTKEKELNFALRAKSGWK